MPNRRQAINCYSSLAHICGTCGRRIKIEDRMMYICIYIYIYICGQNCTNIGSNNGLVACSAPSHHLNQCLIIGCNIKHILDCKHSSQNIFNAKNFNPHKNNPFVKYGHLHPQFAANLVAHILITNG